MKRIAWVKNVAIFFCQDINTTPAVTIRDTARCDAENNHCGMVDIVCLFGEPYISVMDSQSTTAATLLASARQMRMVTVRVADL